MEKLIEIKAEKETYMNELEKLRLDVLKEKSVLESLKQHNITLQKIFKYRFSFSLKIAY